MALRVWLPLNGDLKNQGLSTLVPTGTPTFLDNGKIGKCISLTPRVSFAGMPRMDNFTILFWLKVDSCASDWADSLCFWSFNTEDVKGSDLRFEATKTTRACSFHNNATYTITQASRILITEAQKGEWHHCGFSYDGEHCYTYIDGALTYTDTGLGGYIYNYFHIGETNNMVGGMNDLRIYDECLSQKQIKEISKGLVAHYKLDYPDVESTINLTYGNNYILAVNTGWGAHRATSTDENLYKTYLPFETGTKLVYTYDTSLGTGGGAGFQNKIKRIAIKPSTQYFYSLYVKPGDDFTYFNENFLYRYEYDSSNTKLTEGGVAKKANLIELEDGWYRIWGTFTTKENTNLAEFWFYSYPSKNITYYIGGCQVEEKDHMTPFVAGERNYYPSDCSGNNYNLIMTGNLTYDENSPRYEGSTTFDGNSLNYFYRNAFDFLTNSLTYNCWVYQTSKTTTSSGASSLLQMIMSQGRDYGNASYGMNIDSYNGIPEVRIGKYGVQNIVMAGTTQLVNEQWHMLTATWDGTTVKLYVDGILENTGTVSEVEYTQNSNSFTIGKMAYSHTNTTAYFPFVGSISDVRLYATTLSAEDILTIYKTSGIIDNKNNVYAYEFKEE